MRLLFFLFCGCPRLNTPDGTRTFDEGHFNALENDQTARVKVIMTEPADRKTQHQLIAKVDSIFKSKPFFILKRKLKKDMMEHA